MKFYEEAPEKEDVIKNAYIAKIRGYAKYADEEFLAYATDPKNIIVHRGLACYAGSLVGSGSGTITNCYAEASISVQGSSNRTEIDIGGLVGYNVASISNSYYSGEMSVTGIYERLRTGGLAGYDRKTVTGCWYYSERTSEFGTCRSDGAFTNCYSLSELADEYGSLEQAVEQTVGSIEWLSDTLNWDIEVWTADGGYPELVNSAK